MEFEFSFTQIRKGTHRPRPPHRPTGPQRLPSAAQSKHLLPKELRTICPIPSHSSSATLERIHYCIFIVNMCLPLRFKKRFSRRSGASSPPSATPYWGSLPRPGYYYPSSDGQGTAYYDPSAQPGESRQNFRGAGYYGGHGFGGGGGTTAGNGKNVGGYGGSGRLRLSGRQERLK
ncbi:hypothetical protein GQ607_011561 [Colletotrichum asianum]|uniref:Uncharacterized protein n=1 Tax=Colletotrichum asianum TaxID=702518 RepID=A0A8H3W8L3_9PEZI|nr:hypothetical protein GQ607_011561 [Colletotrichum asianum]